MIQALPLPAKINLYLDVLGRRPDGYHDICSAMVPVAPPLDELSVIESHGPGITVSCGDTRVPQDQTNLVCRAATAFATAARIAPRWHFELTKGIPVAAGLGGGSADAAGTLRLLNEHYESVLAEEELHVLAAGLGADVAFFLKPRPLLAEGTGAELTAIPVGAELAIILVNPGFPVSAAWAYSHLERNSLPAAPPVSECLAALAQGSVAGVAGTCYNALEFAVRDKFPVVDMLIDFLCSNGCATAHVSGSGPTVFGVCEAGRQETIGETLEQRYGSAVWWCSTSVLPVLV